MRAKRIGCGELSLHTAELTKSQLVQQGTLKQRLPLKWVQREAKVGLDYCLV